ncbi:MAG: DNA mismatch repair endonuclease MutL [Phycisphaerae bacterium]|nr:DNA mismatch repair endonuclease MutL [Phycisphaerae bacterium]
MGQISQLSKHLVNKIAAGEVIERPASVLKELVENALDAGATRIDIDVEDGGKKLVQVTDDGGGISGEDVALAFAPHATSKISAEDDLFNINTMGFRGEALASIASISHAQIRTRVADEEGGWEVSASGQIVNDPVPCSAPKGTTIIVRDLFFNTPARRKFLRTTNTEFGHLTEQLTRLALPRPGVGFTLRHNGRLSLHLPATDSTARRVADLFSADLADCLLPLVARTGEIGVDGFVGPPTAARSSAKWQYVFLNGRYIRDRMLSHAVREAYRGLLPPAKYPAVFLFIEVNPADVDVNVHPTKIEVRFRNSNQVYGELLAGLRETLNRSNLTPDAAMPESADLPGETGDKTAGDGDQRASVRQAMADFFKSAPPPPRLNFPQDQSQPSAAAAPMPPDFNRQPLGTPSRTPGEDFTPGSQSAGPTQGFTPQPAAPPQGLTPPGPRGFGPLLQIHNSYIVAQTDDGLVIVDQHALHERLNYNDLQRRLTGGKLSSQKMLIPATVDVTPAEGVLLEESAELLGRLGMEVTAFGPGSVAVQQYPIFLAERGVDISAFLRELLDKLAEDASAGPERIMEEILAMMACKAAVKAGDPLTPAEMQDLLARAENAPKRSSCPHGRPTTIRMTLKDLEKQFSRI